MRYVEVAVDAPIAYDRTLSYSVPDRFGVEPGQMVWVPLGQRPTQGIVFEAVPRPQVDATRDVIAPVEPSPLLTPIGLQLARWMSRYYMSSLFSAAALMLPPGFEKRVRPYLRAGGDPPHGLTSGESALVDLLANRGRITEREAAKSLGSQDELRRLVRRGLVERRWELLRPGASHKYECRIRLAELDTPDTMPVLGRAPRQLALYNALASSHAPLPLSVVNVEYGPGAVTALLSKGLLAMEWTRTRREPAILSRGDGRGEVPVTPTREQERAVARIVLALEGKSQGERAFLIYGVTGSGKTEVYLRALESCLARGKRGIFLVPEIALTPQTVHRLTARFPGRVAILHSRLSPGEQFDQWWRVRDGEYDVVVGPRSALYAPLPDLGLIVVDEEHEWTYKQQEAVPYYHARRVALKLAELSGAVVVMGSATPDVETYYGAKRGEYPLLELPYRVAASGAKTAPAKAAPEGSMARVEISDMRRELKEGNRSIFSRALAESLSECVERGQQAVLFLNRRGSSTVVQCRDCGHALKCRRCSITLTYHSSDEKLRCHQCNSRSNPPRACPACRSPRIRYLGLGTQRVVEELRHLLPKVTALRWDRDAARTPRAHEAIMERFVMGEAQVLIGTQMVAKGLHVPNVTLVGILLADIGLNLPDFRAGERAFQLLCQVAGRAGRGPVPGRVVIQTYDPENYAVEAAAAQDYEHLYEKEIDFRRQLSNPPFTRLVHMTYLHTSLEACQREATRTGRVLRRQAYSLGLTDIEVVGPAPAFPERARGKYRWHIVLRGQNLHSFLEGVGIPEGWMVDVDPISVL